MYVMYVLIYQAYAQYGKLLPVIAELLNRVGGEAQYVTDAATSKFLRSVWFYCVLFGYASYVLQVY